MGDQGREERVYMQTCRKYVRVRIYICIYIRDKMWYMAHNTDVNGERILCLRRSRRKRLKDRGVFISMYSGSAHPWPPVGNVDFFRRPSESGRGDQAAPAKLLPCAASFLGYRPRRTCLSSSPTGFTCKSDFSPWACFPLLSFQF